MTTGNDLVHFTSKLLAALAALRGQDRNLFDGHVSPFKRVTILDRLTGKQPHRIDAGGRIPCRAVFGTGQHKCIVVASNVRLRFVLFATRVEDKTGSWSAAESRDGHREELLVRVRHRPPDQ